MCLWCNDRGKRFETKEDVQRHMVRLFVFRLNVCCGHDDT